VVIEICVKYPGGPTRNRGTDVIPVQYAVLLYGTGYECISTNGVRGMRDPRGAPKHYNAV
jgi:hypothetical protein